MSVPGPGCILVGDDGSPRAQEAVAFARYLSDAVGGEVRMLRAEAPAAEQLRAAAEREGAAYVVVGASHVRPIGRVVPGSTAERVARAAPCPVIVVPADWHRTFESAPRTIGVGADDSPESDAAVAHAAGLARAWRARLRIFAVRSPIAYPYAATSAVAAGALEETTDRDARDRLDRLVASVDDELDAQGVLLAGDAQRELAAHSRGLAVLVVGSRGYRPLGAILAGGVSGRLIRTAECPVLVVPRTSAPHRAA